LYHGSLGGTLSANEHYDAVLLDLQQMKEDAEDGIRAIKRLMSRAMGAGIVPTQAPTDASVANRIIAFLAAQEGRSVRIPDLIKGIAPVNDKTLRGTLGRLAKAGKIGKHGRGRYRSARQARTGATSS
jgi:hypothetical protein